MRRKRKQVGRNTVAIKCPRCGGNLKKMRDPEGKEWNFCKTCFDFEQKKIEKNGG